MESATVLFSKLKGVHQKVKKITRIQLKNLKFLLKSTEKPIFFSKSTKKTKKFFRNQPKNRKFLSNQLKNRIFVLKLTKKTKNSLDSIKKSQRSFTKCLMVIMTILIYLIGSIINLQNRLFVNIFYPVNFYKVRVFSHTYRKIAGFWYASYYRLSVLAMFAGEANDTQ